MSEVVSQPLPQDLPPWQVTLITTWDGRSGEGETWVVARAHHLLASSLSLPDLLVEAYPDPWLKPGSRGLSILTAPAATARLAEAVLQGVTSTVERLRFVYASLSKKLIPGVLSPALALLEEAAQASSKMGTEAVPVDANVVYLTTLLVRRVQSRLSSVRDEVRERLREVSVPRVGFFCALRALKLMWHCVVWIARLPVRLVMMYFEAVNLVRRVMASEGVSLVVEATVEMYWMTRAFVSLPRLVLETLCVRGDTPLMGWTGHHERRLSRRGSGRQARGGVTVAWSDPVPLSTVRGVRGATGASLGEVLLTASAGAVRDYLRVTGLPVPEEVSCTVPVYSQRWAEGRGEEVNSTGLVTLALPTGAAEASSALRLVRQSIMKIQSYPERYLASVWLIRNVAYFLPASLLGATFRALSSRYPVFLSNLAGPQKPVTLWGHDLLNLFHWRPPCDGAGKSEFFLLIARDEFIPSFRGEALRCTHKVGCSACQNFCFSFRLLSSVL